MAWSALHTSIRRLGYQFRCLQKNGANSAVLHPLRESLHILRAVTRDDPTPEGALQRSPAFVHGVVGLLASLADRAAAEDRR